MDFSILCQAPEVISRQVSSDIIPNSPEAGSRLLSIAKEKRALEEKMITEDNHDQIMNERMRLMEEEVSIRSAQSL